MNAFEGLLLASVLACASITDIARRRVPNTMLAVTASFAAAAAFAGTADGAFARLALGAATGLLFALPLFAFKAVGAGDAKLFAVVGMIVGPAIVPSIALHTALAGGALALVTLITTAHGRRYAAQRASSASRDALRSGAAVSPRLPYAVAIAVGTALAVLR